MDLHPLVEQLLMICPQHSLNIIENTVSRYQHGGFGEAELLQVCLDDLVDQPDLDQINSQSGGFHFGGTNMNKADSKQDNPIVLEFSEPKFNLNATVKSPANAQKTSDSASSAVLKENLKNADQLPDIHRGSPHLRKPGSNLSPLHGLSKASETSDVSMKKTSTLSSSPSPFRDSADATVEDVQSVIREANDIYNMFSRPKAEAKGEGKRKAHEMLNSTPVVSTASGGFKISKDAQRDANSTPKRTLSSSTLTSGMTNSGEWNTWCTICGKKRSPNRPGQVKSTFSSCACFKETDQSARTPVKEVPKTHPAAGATSTGPAFGNYLAESLKEKKIARAHEIAVHKQRIAERMTARLDAILSSSGHSGASGTRPAVPTPNRANATAAASARPAAATTAPGSATRAPPAATFTPAKSATPPSTRPGTLTTPAKSAAASVNGPTVSKMPNAPSVGPCASKMPAGTTYARAGTSATPARSATSIKSTTPAGVVAAAYTRPTVPGTPTGSVNTTAGSAFLSTTPAITATAGTAAVPGTSATPVRPGTAKPDGPPAATVVRPGAPQTHTGQAAATPARVGLSSVSAGQQIPVAQRTATPPGAPLASARVPAAAPARAPAAAPTRAPAAAPARAPTAAPARAPTAAPAAPPPAAAPPRPPAAAPPRPPAAAPATPARPAEAAPPAEDRQAVNGFKVDMITQLFPDVDPNHVEALKRRFADQGGPDMVTNIVCNELLENGYPKREAANAEPAAPIPSPERKADYYSDQCSDEILGAQYHRQARKILEKDFSKMRAGQLDDLYVINGYRYAKTRKHILDLLKKAGVEYRETCHQNLFHRREMGYVSYAALKVNWSLLKTINLELSSRSKEIVLLKNERRVAFTDELHDVLRKEIQFVHADALQRHEELFRKADLEMASQLNMKDYEETGQSIECGCCYGDYPFEDMVQCFEGHLFCANCLKSYTQEAVFGQGKSRLQCMSEDCDAGYPRSMMERVLTPQMIEKFEEREQFEALNLADIENLFKCPACQFAAIIEPQVRVFVCQSPACKKECCTKCKEDWKDHIGKKCEEVEKKDETKLRLEAEEKMTQAKIRFCSKCKKGLVKSEGCNKMTCTCGGTMCYICRLPNIDYKHFCQHVREPGKGCTVCEACSLWTNPDQDDERAIEEIRQQALEDAKSMGFAADKQIGAPGEPPAKKRKTDQPPQYHPHVL